MTFNKSTHPVKVYFFRVFLRLVGQYLKVSINMFKSDFLVRPTLSMVQAKTAITSFMRLKHTLVLVRHGESTWNKSNQFTGWYDCSLSEKGHDEAVAAGKLIKEEGFFFYLNACK